MKCLLYNHISLDARTIVDLTLRIMKTSIICDFFWKQKREKMFFLSLFNVVGRFSQAIHLLNAFADAAVPI